MFPGVGTVVNVLTVLAGAGLGILVGHRLRERTREVVTDALGLVTLLIAAVTVQDVASPALAAYVGSGAPVLIVLGSLVVGGVVGSSLRLEERVEAFGGILQRRLVRGAGAEDDGERRRFVEGFVAASVLFCSGPLTVLGSLEDGLGRGADLLFLKATLDGFAALALAASFGWGVAASVVTVILVQGGLTLVGLGLGDVLPEAHVAALGATGGLLLVAVGLRLLRIRQIPVADLLPALLISPVLVEVVARIR